MIQIEFTRRFVSALDAGEEEVGHDWDGGDGGAYDDAFASSPANDSFDMVRGPNGRVPTCGGY